MASQLQDRVARAKQANYKDSEIWNELRKNSDFNNRVKQARAAGFTQDQIAQELGLKVKFIDSKPKSNYQPFDNTKEARQKREQEALKKQGPTQLWESALLGAADIGIPFVQAAQYTKDKINQGINAVAGTKLPTNSYEGVTKTYKNINNTHNTVRKANNQGVDVGRIGANMAMTAPLAAAGGTLKAGVPLASKAGAEFLTRNAAVGGLIGATGIHENNTERLKSMGAGAVGGALGAAAGDKIGKAASSINRRVNPTQVTNAQVESSIDIALSQMDDGVNGIRLADLPAQAQTQLKKEVKNLMLKGKSPDAQTLQRMGVFAEWKAKGFDLKPTLKQATGDAQLWTKETNLSKLDGAEKLAKKYTQDHANLKGLLDDFELKTGGTASDEFQVGDDLFNALRRQDDSRNSYVAAMYDQAKKHTGNDLLLDGGRFANNMKQSLDEDLVDINLLPAPLLKKVQDFANGTKPFTLAEKEMLIKQINRRMSGADKQTKYALQSFRNSLEKEVDTSLDTFGTALNGSAKKAWDDARKAASGRFGVIDRTPALKKALADAEPDKAFEQLVWRGNIRELDSLLNEVKHDPQVVNNMRQAVVKRIANKSLGANDVFSPKGMADAIKAIGDRKLSLLFSPDEIKQLKNIEMAAKFLISQPPGANVNNSNTASTLMNYFSTFTKFPFVNEVAKKFAVNPVRGVNAQVKINQGASALSKTATQSAPSRAEQEVIDQLVKLGVIGGANTTSR